MAQWFAPRKSSFDGEKPMSDPTYKKIEIVGTSSKSFSDAAANGIAKAAETVHGISWFEVTEQAAASWRERSGNSRSRWTLASKSTEEAISFQQSADTILRRLGIRCNLQRRKRLRFSRPIAEC